MNKILLENSHAHSFTYFPWLFSCCNSKVEQLWQIICWNIYYLDLSKIKFAYLWSRIAIFVCLLFVRYHMKLFTWISLNSYNHSERGSIIFPILYEKIETLTNSTKSTDLVNPRSKPSNPALSDSKACTLNHHTILPPCKGMPSFFP